jgi:lysine decarboxylase
LLFLHQITPIYSALKNYVEENNLRLHMPGHIGGQGISAEELKAIALFDQSEVPGLDDLHLPLDVIKKSRKLLAEAYGAGESFFLINGATSGIHSLFLSMNQGSKILIPRNAHRSFFGGMVLSAAVPVYMPCQFEPELGIALSVKSEDIADLLFLHPDVQAAFITSPSYYGTTCDIKSLSRLSRAAGKILCVDEAHGGHFPFHESYPKPALKAGADAAVNGLHKTMPVLNQGACLHLSSDFPHKERVSASWSLLSTSSPSYPILASIDLARDLMKRKGRSLLDTALGFSLEYKGKIGKIKGLRVFDDELKKVFGVHELDPLKILVSVKDLKIDGYELSWLLRHRYQIQVEIEEQHYIMAMMSIFHQKSDWERFYQALKDIAASYISGQKLLSYLETPPEPQVILNPREAFFAARKEIRLDLAAGEVSAEMVAAYPPGIPCLLPGELITKEVLAYLEYLRKSGSHIQGADDPELKSIKVINQ